MSENAILAALRRMGYPKEEMTGHGFRSMASTLLHEQGWNHQAIERQLAHAERNVQGDRERSPAQLIDQVMCSRGGKLSVKLLILSARLTALW